jgi:hypothetical protein
MAKETIIPKGYEIERLFFDLIAENEAIRSKVKSYHSSLHRYLVFLCNKFYWKNPIDVHTSEAMLYSGIGDHRTYKQALQDLSEWGLIIWVFQTKNQWRANKVHICFGEITKANRDNLEQEYKDALVNSQKQSKSTPEALQKQSKSTPVYSKQEKTSKLNKLSQTDEREISEILDNEDSEVTPLITPKNQGKKRGAGGGSDLKSDIIKYFVANNWSEALAVKYYDTYAATNWTHNGEKIKSWQAFAKGFIDKQPSQPQTTSTYRGIEPPPNFW